jgi:hypothetical protein
MSNVFTIASSFICLSPFLLVQLPLMHIMAHLSGSGYKEHVVLMSM